MSIIYDGARESFLGGDADWNADTLNVYLVDTDYSSAVGHVWTDVSGNTVAASTLGSPTITDGVADAADVTFSAVTGAQVDTIIIRMGATDEMICIDGFTAVTPNGGDIEVQWDSGANKIFKL